ncbi:MAG TPA: TssQ family T6SS-associated lipoprotein [Usitatibacter sp.]|jgi:tetratricopeptide (TPR) repeat protein|nr:TssQ family T6SS-associated lipoprotein [Usitatibacter sp.]
MKKDIAHRFILVALLLAAAGCQNLPGTEGQQQPAAPQITESVLRERAQLQLTDGVKQYDAGDYDNAVKSLQASLEHGMLSKADQARARKYLAFSHCVSGRESLCSDEFRKAFEIYPDFSLTPAEDGHPIWGPVYRSVRTQLISEREAQQPKPLIPLGKAEQMLQDGMVKYDAGEYPPARTLLEGALKEGLSTKENRVRAMKTIAFTLCLEKKFRECRTEFIRIYDVDPDFDLAPAEAGHPSWTHTFAHAKADAQRALKEKELREARENKAKGPPPTAGTKP